MGEDDRTLGTLDFLADAVTLFPQFDRFPFCHWKGTKREAGENPARGRRCNRPGARTPCHCDLIGAGRQFENRHEPKARRPACRKIFRASASSIRRRWKPLRGFSLRYLGRNIQHLPEPARRMVSMSFSRRWCALRLFPPPPNSIPSLLGLPLLGCCARNPPAVFGRLSYSDSTTSRLMGDLLCFTTFDVGFAVR
jgi:hypothetical protein